VMWITERGLSRLKEGISAFKSGSYSVLLKVIIAVVIFFW